MHLLCSWRWVPPWYCQYLHRTYRESQGSTLFRGWRGRRDGFCFKLEGEVEAQSMFLPGFFLVPGSGFNTFTHGITMVSVLSGWRREWFILCMREGDTINVLTMHLPCSRWWIPSRHCQHLQTRRHNSFLAQWLEGHEGVVLATWHDVVWGSAVDGVAACIAISFFPLTIWKEDFTKVWLKMKPVQILRDKNALFRKSEEFTLANHHFHFFHSFSINS